MGDEPVEFEKYPAEIQDCRRLPIILRGICRIYPPNFIKENRMMSTCNRLGLQTLGGSQLVMLKNLPDHWLTQPWGRWSLGESAVSWWLVAANLRNTDGRPRSSRRPKRNPLSRNFFSPCEVWRKDDFTFEVTLMLMKLPPCVIPAKVRPIYVTSTHTCLSSVPARCLIRFSLGHFKFALLPRYLPTIWYGIAILKLWVITTHFRNPTSGGKKDSVSSLHCILSHTQQLA